MAVAVVAVVISISSTCRFAARVDKWLIADKIVLMFVTGEAWHLPNTQTIVLFSGPGGILLEEK